MMPEVNSNDSDFDGEELMDEAIENLRKRHIDYDNSNFEEELNEEYRTLLEKKTGIIISDDDFDSALEN